MRQVKWVLICLLVLFAVSFVFQIGCTPQAMGKTGFDVKLSVTGMTRITSVFGVMRSLMKTDALVIDDAVSEHVKAALIKTVEDLGFQASVESIEPRKVAHKLVIN